MRGYLALGLICLGMLLSDLVQRILIGPLVWLVPALRDRVLNPWAHALQWLVSRPLEVIGGAKISRPPRIPGEEGILIIMNHQSLLDIPLLVDVVEKTYPRIVTRRRYARGIPLISHVLRLYQYPVVDPSANHDEMLEMLGAVAEQARTSKVPIAIFPEGTRTRNGEIARFKSRGLSLLLAQRPWKVYAFVVDGFWEQAKFKDFFDDVSKINGRMELVDTFDWPDPEAEAKPFIREIRQRMIEHLAEMRGRVPA